MSMRYIREQGLSVSGLKLQPVALVPLRNETGLCRLTLTTDHAPAAISGPIGEGAPIARLGLEIERTCGRIGRARRRTLFNSEEGWFHIRLARNFPVHTEGKWFSKMFLLCICRKLREWEETDNKTYPSKRGKRISHCWRYEQEEGFLPICHAGLSTASVLLC